MSPTICTFSGTEFDIFNPAEESVHIIDIAHSLSQQCRFGGHTRRFYSVAEHSVLVSRLCDPADAQAALLHDAAEAYCVDLPTPIKRNIHGYSEIERGILKVIFRRFGLGSVPLMPTSVAAADKKALDIEQYHLMPHVDWWPTPPSAIGQQPACLDPLQAKTLFMNRFRELFPDQGHHASSLI